MHHCGRILPRRVAHNLRDSSRQVFRLRPKPDILRAEIQGMTMRLIRGLLLALGGVLLIPALASAQSLAGAVRDTSGAALPGVTVEASSPALITKVRTSVTDTSGQYRIPDLPPGTYKIT